MLLFGRDKKEKKEAGASPEEGVKISGGKANNKDKPGGGAPRDRGSQGKGNQKHRGKRAPRKSRFERWFSGSFFTNAFKAGRYILQKNQLFKSVAGWMALLKKGRAVLLLPHLSSGGGWLPAYFFNSTLVISIAITLLLVGLTMLYLHFLHAKSDSTRIKELRSFRTKLRDKLVRLNCSPLMLRLAWSDSATYDKAIKQWPLCGGATGSIRFERETRSAANAGLEKAIEILQEIKAGYKTVSWADAIQMAGALAVHVTGGPEIAIRYGRTDAPENNSRSDEGSGKKNAVAANAVASTSPPFYSAGVLPSPASTSSSSSSASSSSSRANPSGRSSKLSGCPAAALSARLPGAVPPFPDHSPSADVHIRTVFYRMGFSNRDIVALCGAHTIGRAFHDRTGVCPNTSGDRGATVYTRPTSIAKVSREEDGSGGIGMPGGCSWTRNWLHFDNSYFLREEGEAELLWLPTDRALHDCPEFKPYFQKYAKDQQSFFADYAAAHRKMSENGAKFRPTQGLQI